MGKVNRWKKAGLGGDGQDQSFEQAFSNLAHAYLQDKAPSLLEYEQGFQLLDRDNDNTKAVGVTGFKVGGQQIYLPVFFLQGDLKGHELMYLKNKDMFVPLKENWVNYILNRKPELLGESVDKSTIGRGVQSPDLARMTSSPGKYASAMPKWAVEYIMDIYEKIGSDFSDSNTKLARYTQEVKSNLSLINFVHNVSYPIVTKLVKFASEYPGIAVGIKQFYGDVDFIEDALKSSYVKYREKKSALNSKPKVNVITGSILDAPVKKGGVTIVVHRDISINSVIPNEKPKNLAEDVVEEVEVIDGRAPEDVTKVINTEYTETYYNPTENNVYSVLTADFENVPCFVAVHPYKENGTYYKSAVIPLTDGLKSAKPNQTINAAPSSVWCNSKMCKKEYTEWFDNLPKEDISQANKAVCITPSGDVVGPFYVDFKRNFKEDRIEIYQIGFEIYDSGSDEPSLFNPDRMAQGHKEYCYSSKNHRDYGKYTLCVSEQSGNKVVFTKSMRYIVPKGSKFLVLGRKDKYDNFIDEEENKNEFVLATGADVDNKTWRFKKSSVLVESLKLAEKECDKDILKGGLGDNKSCDDFNEKQIAKGIKVETEHTSSKQIAMEVAKDHLEEIPDYYTRLADMESKAKKEAKFKLGTPIQAQAYLINKTAQLKVYNNGRECIIDNSRFTPMRALSYLITNRGLREKSARFILKKAEINPGHIYKCRIKVADPFLTDQQYSAPGMLEPPQTSNMMGSPIPTYGTFEQEQPVPGLEAAMTDPQTYNMRPEMMPSPYDAMWAQQAAEGGQKEIFDTKIMSALLKNICSDDMTDKFLGDLMKALDKIGRILFMFYWHGERFSERYGKADMAELEDSLRNSFEILGDLIIFLKQKTIEPYPEEADVDLDTVADI